MTSSSARRPLSPPYDLPPLPVPDTRTVLYWVLFRDFDPTLPTPPVLALAEAAPTLAAHRLAAVALRLLQELGVTLPSEATAQLRAGAFLWGQRTATALTLGRAALDTLPKTSVPFVVTKGLGIALHHRSLAERPFSDVDIVVPKACYHKTLRHFESSGYSEREESKPPWRLLVTSCREAVNLESPAGGRLDVHHRIPPWIWGDRVTFAKLQQHSRAHRDGPFSGHPLAATVDNFIISTLHIISDRNRPGESVMIWRDILFLLENLTDTEILEASLNYRLLPWVRWILSALPPNTVRTSLTFTLSAARGSLPHPRRTALLLASPSRRNVILNQTLRLPTWRAALFLIAMLLPGPAFLRARFPNSHRRYRLWWLQGWDTLTTNPLSPSPTSPTRSVHGDSH